MRHRPEYINPRANRVPRRVLLKSLGVAAGAALFSSSGCDRPNREGGCPQVAGRQLRWLVPFSPGGGYDIYSRLIQPFYQEKVGASIVVENMPGAAGAVCANTLSQSKPDGLTLGFVNAPGLLAAAMTEGGVPNPARDMTVLGRVVRSRLVWSASARSSLRTIEDVLLESRKRPIVFAISEVGSTSFVGIVVGTALLGINAEFVSGYAGGRQTVLGLLRGEADIMSATFESVLDQIEPGDLKPILQMTGERIAPHLSLEGVPFLCGDAGLAARRASELGRDKEQITADADTLAGYLGAGLVVVGPPALERGLFECLEQRLHEALTDTRFQAGAAEARRSLDVARATEAQREIEKAASEVQRFIPALQESINKLRRR